MTGRTMLAGSLALGLVLGAGPALAAGMSTEHETKADVQAFSHAKVSLDQAIAAVRTQSNGKVLDVTFQTKGGTPAYDATAFVNDQVKHWTVDAANGRVTAGTEPSVARANLDAEDAAELTALNSATIDLKQAVATAEQKSGGKAIDAGLEQRGGTVAYEIQTVKNGKMQTVTVDPRSGQVSSSG